MPTSIATLVPSADDLLALEVEELAGVLLVHLNSYDHAVNQGLLSPHNILRTLEQYPDFPGRQSEVNRALMEAWNWLEGEGFLVREPSQPAGWFFLSRRARRMNTRDDFARYRKASLLPRGQLHPLIASRVYPAFLRGEYDTAVFQAFREIEVAVRKAGNFPDDLVGVDLMREAFRPVNPNSAGAPGPLTDASLPVAEQVAMMSLFAGAIGLYKNPQSHRNVPTEPTEGAEVIVFASQLLRTVDRRMPTTAAS